LSIIFISVAISANKQKNELSILALQFLLILLSFLKVSRSRHCLPFTSLNASETANLKANQLNKTFTATAFDIQYTETLDGSLTHILMLTTKRAAAAAVEEAEELFDINKIFML
jgi:hypothetical protein